jgi:hypothetical protein
MSIRAISFGAMAMLASLIPASRVTAQITLPPKSYQTLSVQIQSLRDNITLFRGDPQRLLQMEVRPNRFRPRIDYFDQSDATLKIRDLYAVDHPDFTSQSPAERDKAGDPPLSEEWEIRLTPVAPTTFALQLERGESTLDFSDFEVQGVQLRAEESKLEIQFSSQNSIPLERFAARVIAGTLRFEHMLNARAKEISLDLPNSECQLEITGKEFEGESAINLLGVPAKMHLLLSSQVGLRVTGPAATIAKFEGSHMSRAGDELVTKGYAEAKCRIHLTFGSEVPELGVEWE